MDASTCENLILAISKTNEWQKAEKLLEMIKLTCKPSATAYSIIISTAFTENAMDVGWRLLHEMVEDFDRIPKCQVFITYFKWCHQQLQNNIEHIEKMLNFIGQNRIMVSKAVVDELRNIFEKNDMQCQYTSIGHK